MALRPGEIYWAYDGSGGRRPFVVISREELNRGKYFLAVPFTSARYEQRKDQPSCVPFQEGDHGLPKTCVAQAEALTQLRRADLGESIDLIGRLDASAHRDLIKAIGNAIGGRCEPDAMLVSDL